MAVIVARIGMAAPGKQGEALAFVKKRAEAIKKVCGFEPEVRIRMGGHIGEVMTMSRHKDLAEVEAIKKKVVDGTMSGTIPTSPAGVFSDVSEQIWVTQ